jgi:hypothetical protein
MSSPAGIIVLERPSAQQPASVDPASVDLEDANVHADRDALYSGFADSSDDDGDGDDDDDVDDDVNDDNDEVSVAVTRFSAVESDNDA